MTSGDPLPAPPGLLTARDKEYLANAGVALGVFIPAGVVTLALSARTLRAALRSNPGPVRALLMADVLSDFAVAGYAVGKARQLKKTETEEETRERVARVRPITWKSYVRPLRDAAVIGLATSTTRSVRRSVASGVLAYAFSIGLMHAARVVRPCMVRASELSAEFVAERRAREEAAERGDKSPGEQAVPDDRVRSAISALEKLAGSGTGSGKTTLSPGSLERILGDPEGKDAQPRAYTPGPELDAQAEGDEVRVNVLGTDVPRDKFAAALQRKLDEQERRIQKGMAHDALLNPDQPGRDRPTSVDDIVE